MSLERFFFFGEMSAGTRKWRLRPARLPANKPLSFSSSPPSSTSKMEHQTEVWNFLPLIRPPRVMWPQTWDVDPHTLRPGLAETLFDPGWQAGAGVKSGISWISFPRRVWTRTLAPPGIKAKPPPPLEAWCGWGGGSSFPQNLSDTVGPSAILTQLKNFPAGKKFCPPLLLDWASKLGSSSLEKSLLSIGEERFAKGPFSRLQSFPPAITSSLRSKFLI